MFRERMGYVGVLCATSVLCAKSKPARDGGVRMNETDINFLRRQAEHCIALSRATFDLTVAGRLRIMADEFRARASQWADETDHMPPPAVARDGAANGKLTSS